MSDEKRTLGLPHTTLPAQIGLLLDPMTHEDFQYVLFTICMFLLSSDLWPIHILIQYHWNTFIYCSMGHQQPIKVFDGTQIPDAIQ